MKRSVLSAAQVEQFIADGFVVLRHAFPRSVADEIRARIWKAIGLHPEQPENWTKPAVYLNKNFGGDPFTQAFTPRVIGAFDDVMGEGRWEQQFHLGWWPIAFPGFDSKPWRAPQSGWHIDGYHFHHRLASREQGLLPIFIFSDIEAGGGGTALSIGSHTITANVLAEAEPHGLSMDELTRRVVAHPRSRSRVIEATGEAGDVVLIHPFLLHARSPNTGSSVRFICNPCFALKEEMRFDRPEANAISPVERAIVNALPSLTI
ncbi:MAG TPA: phytanoyl-CoA dioxygenase family protein [Planctomycetota bacterium]|nr:phytanoyl-CoA dioxygenase family protein [Planctomycetota bacterium]